MTNVLVARKKDIKVSINAAGIINSNINRLDHLLDVDASGEVENATLVYNVYTDKYVVKKLNLADIDGNLDGGIF